MLRMKDIVHSVLGTEYEVLFGAREEIHMSEENMGECKVYAKEILVCTDRGDCDEGENIVRVQEIVAHEFFHAYANEAGLDLDPDTEERVACFFMKTWRKMTNSILAVLDESGFLDN